MRRIKIDGQTYEVHSDDLRFYDSYYYKGELLEHAPPDANVVGYIVDGQEKIGICKRSLKKFLPVLYGGIGLSAAGVIAFGVFVFSQEYHVTPWRMSVLEGGDGSGELDDGVERVNKKFSYSRYVTYDGENVQLYYDTSYKDGEIALNINGTTTEFRPIEEAYNVPMALELNNEDVIEGTLLLKRGDKVEEYPLAVERLQLAEQIQLAAGTEFDRDQAYNQIMSEVIQAGEMEDPTSVTGNVGNLELSKVTDDGVNIDFGSFTVLKPRKDRIYDDTSGEVYNSEVDVLNQ